MCVYIYIHTNIVLYSSFVEYCTNGVIVYTSLMCELLSKSSLACGEKLLPNLLVQILKLLYLLPAGRGDSNCITYLTEKSPSQMLKPCEFFHQHLTEPWPGQRPCHVGIELHFCPQSSGPAVRRPSDQSQSV